MEKFNVNFPKIKEIRVHIIHFSQKTDIEI